MSKPFESIIWALIATGLFSLSAALGKLAAEDFHILQILFVRQMIVLISVLPIIARTFPQGLMTQYPLVHAARLVGAFVGLAAGLWAVSALPLTTAITLMFSQAFLIALLAGRFLGESLGRHRLCSIGVGFIGVLVVMRPDPAALIDPMALVALVAALGAAVAVVSVRKLTQTDGTATLLSYQAIFVGLMSGVPMIWLWTAPSGHEVGLLVGIGVIATAAQWVGIKALRLGEASLVSAVKYTEVIFAGLLGFWMFAEVPDLTTLVGATIIIASALYVIRREAQLAKAKAFSR